MAEDSGDRLGTLTTLTAAGRELIGSVTAAHLANEKRLLSALKQDEPEALASFLRTLLSGLPHD